METKILQFGEGNFLRCFIDWMIEKANRAGVFQGGVEIIQPIGETLSGASAALNARGGKYHTCLRGIVGGQKFEELDTVSCVKGVHLADAIERLAVIPSVRFVVSNTTEAGIQYVKGSDTFPAKVYRLLKARHAARLPGLIFIPCELIEHNGNELKRCTLAYAADAGDRELADWIERECVFCATLVDRIVAGRPDPESAARYAAQLGERDETLVCGEPFHFFVVEEPAGFSLERELPLKAAGINVVYTPDMQPYRTRKVRFLNAAHTTIVHLALERGFEEVAQVVADEAGNRFLRQILFEEIFPTVNLPADEKRAYAESVLERFANPFAHHKLASIALNTAAKWKARCLPVVCDYFKLYGKLPAGLMRGYDANARHFDKN